jgi:hypothetical protein
LTFGATSRATDPLRHAVRQIKRFQFDTKRHGRDRATGMCSIGRVILSKVGLTPEEARDPAIRLEVRTQIKLLELAAEEVQDEWLGFHLARSFDLREIGLV